MKPPESLGRRLTDKMADLYARTVDAFLRKIGVDESDTNVVFVEYNNNPTFREVRRDDVLLGTIFYGVEPAANGGLQFVVRCIPCQQEPCDSR